MRQTACIQIMAEMNLEKLIVESHGHMSLLSADTSITASFQTIKPERQVMVRRKNENK
jgi:hypothetical protein